MTEIKHSFRFTPKFINDFDATPEEILQQLYGENQENVIVVEETAANTHYHILLTTTINIGTIRSRFRKAYEPEKDNYYLKLQKESEEELNKAYRYLYKGENSKTLPIIVQTYHTEEEIKAYHQLYWEIYEKITDTTSNVEKCYQYLKATFGEKLITMTRPMIATEITLSRMNKQKPPMPRHSLITFLEYIEFRIKSDMSHQCLQTTILDYFDNIQLY